MWLKFLLLFLLFGFLEILQNSFLAHFNIMGATVNPVFILFFLVVFFSGQNKVSFDWKSVFFSAIIAGFFSDIFLSSYFGTTTVFLLMIAFISKKLISLLKGTKDKYPVVYFIPLFILAFLLFNLLQKTFYLNWIFLVEIIYNFIFAMLGYYIYKKFNLYEFSE
jgi:Fe2+ transport system protein B